MTHSKNQEQQKHIINHNLMTIFLCILGIATNLLLGKICEMSGLPLYLDTVGTVACTIMGGYLPGVIVGFATNLFKSVYDASALYYGILNVLIALSAAWFTKKRWFKKPHK